YERGVALTEVPVIHAIAMTRDEIIARAVQLRDAIANTANGRFNVTLEEGASVIGGGSAPEVQLPTTLVALEDAQLSAASLEERLRSHAVPIITRTERDRVMIDLRTVLAGEEEIILEAIAALAQPAPEIAASVEL